MAKKSDDLRTDECQCENCTLTRGEEEVDFMSAEYDDFDHALLANDAPIPDDMLKPVTTEELLEAQMGDMLCSKVRARLNGGELLPFALKKSASSSAPWNHVHRSSSRLPSSESPASEPLS